jgi:hypothetical protein
MPRRSRDDADLIGLADLKSTRVSIVPFHLLLPYRQEARTGRQTTMMQEFHKRLRLIIMVEGNYRAAAKKLGVSRATILRWMDARNFPLLAQAKRIDVAYWSALRRIQLGTVRGRRNIRHTRFLEKVARDNGLCNIAPPEETPER